MKAIIDMLRSLILFPFVILNLAITVIIFVLVLLSICVTWTGEVLSFSDPTISKAKFRAFFRKDRNDEEE